MDNIASMFIAFSEGDKKGIEGSPLVKLVSASEFSADDRWDVTRFWDDKELVDLGEMESSISRIEFIDESISNIAEISSELEAAKDELTRLTAAPMVSIPLSDQNVFRVRARTRIRDEDIRLNPGKIPVYSCFKDASIVKGHINEAWLLGRDIPIEGKPIVTVNANGASFGKVFVRNERCVITDDVIAIEVLLDNIDHGFVAVQLRSAVAAGGFLYEAKLFLGCVKDLEVRLPIKPDGTYDTEQQRVIAAAVKRFDMIRQRLSEIGEWSISARIA